MPVPCTAGSVVGIDIGGTNLRLALVSGEGAVIERRRLFTDIRCGKDAFLHKLFSEIDQLAHRAAELCLPVKGIGVGMPGLIQPSGQIRESVNLRALDGFNLAAALTEHAKLPATVLNDANAAALGELWYGAGRPYASFLMVTLGTGVGGGLVLNRTIWTGADGTAGEFGHVTVEPDGVSCSCGNRGCLEQYASATVLKRAAAAGGWRSVRELSYAAFRGNAAALAPFVEAGRYLGIASASVVNLLNLDAVIIGGGLAQSFELIAGPLREEITRRAFPVPAGRVAVTCGELGDDAGVLGSAACAFALLQKNP
jgi:glucokinase